MIVNAALRADDIIEALAFRQVVDGALKGTQHSSRLAKLPKGSWQSEIIAQSDEVFVANSSAELREALARPDTTVVFLPHTSSVDAIIIERLSTEAPFGKTIVWETDQ